MVLFASEEALPKGKREGRISSDGKNIELLEVAVARGKYELMERCLQDWNEQDLWAKIASINVSPMLVQNNRNTFPTIRWKWALTRARPLGPSRGDEIYPAQYSRQRSEPKKKECDVLGNSNGSVQRIQAGMGWSCVFHHDKDPR